MKSVLRSLPEGLLGPRAFPSLRRWLERLVGVVMASAGLGVLVLFASARLGGVADFPAFEKLPKYELHNHGQRTEVSRFRYVTVSASFALGWHSGAALMSLVCLYRLLYGKVPKQFSKEE
jgi:cytochrome c biogenesis protein CcdA